MARKKKEERNVFDEVMDETVELNDEFDVLLEKVKECIRRVVFEDPTVSELRECFRALERMNFIEAQLHNKIYSLADELSKLKLLQEKNDQ